MKFSTILAIYLAILAFVVHTLWFHPDGIFYFGGIDPVDPLNPISSPKDPNYDPGY